MNDFKLQFYFNLYKNKPFVSSEIFRAKFKKIHGDFECISRLVIMIENYQIKKYGCLLKDGSMDKISRQERIRKL